MTFFFFIFLLFSFQLLVVCQESLEVKRIILIGDSVDRFCVEDWCSHVKGRLHTDRLHPEISVDNPFKPDKTLDMVLEQLASRNRAWELRVCDGSRTQSTIISFIANKFGVQPHPPWHTPAATISGLNPAIFDNLTVADVFDVGIAPGLKILEEFMGNKSINGVMINSAFWDLSHPDIYDFRLNPTRRQEWLQSWAGNATLLMQSVKRYFPPTTWLAWRTGNRLLAVPRETEHRFWNTQYAVGLLLDMNKISRTLAKENGFEIVEFFDENSRMRDYLHPHRLHNVPIIQSVVDKISIIKRK